MIGLLKRAALGAALLLLAIAAPSHTARAGIVLMVAEDVDCQFIGTVNVDTNTAHFRSGYARLALSMQFNSVTDPPANRCVTPTISPLTAGWLHTEAFQEVLTNTSLGMNAIEIYGPDGIVHWVVRGTGTNGQVKLSKRSTAGGYADVATCTSGIWPAVSLHALDIHLIVSVTGEFGLYVDGNPACDFLGDTTQDGQTSFNQADFGGTNINSAPNDWSEIIFSTDDTRGVGVFTCAPGTTGNAWVWTGGVANINETVINDANGSSTGATGQMAEFKCANSLPSGSFTYPAVQLTARDEVGVGGPQHNAPVIRPATGSTDYLGTNIALTTSFANYHYLWTLNPATSAAFSAADFGTSFNLGQESQP